MIQPANGRTTSTQAAAVRKRRSARELALIFVLREAIAESADGLDHVGRDLLAQPADEHLDGIRVAVEILLVQVLDQLGARCDALLVMHQVGKQAVFVRRKPYGLAVGAYACG